MPHLGVPYFQLSSMVGGEAGVPGWGCGGPCPLGQLLVPADEAELRNLSGSHPHEVGPALVVCWFQSVEHVIPYDLGSFRCVRSWLH